jgi:hypothetical protein
MPVVKTETVKLPKDGSYVEFKKLIKFTSTSKTGYYFTIELPEWMRGAVEKDLVQGANLDEVETKFKEAVDEFEARSSKKEKVIVYRFQCCALVTKKNEKGEEETLFKQEKGSYMDDSPLTKTMLELYFQTGFRTTFNGRTFYETSRGDRLNTYHDRINKAGNDYVIPWTQEKEDFFQKLKEQMATMAMNAYNFLTQEPAQLEDYISKNKSLIFKGDGVGGQ